MRSVTHCSPLADLLTELYISPRPALSGYVGYHNTFLHQLYWSIKPNLPVLMSIFTRKKEIMASYSNADADSNTDFPDYGCGVDTFEDGAAPSVPLSRMVQISPVVIVEISISTRFGRRVEVIIS